MEPNQPQTLKKPENKAQDGSGTQDINNTTKSVQSLAKTISSETPAAEQKGTDEKP